MERGGEGGDWYPTALKKAIFSATHCWAKMRFQRSRTTNAQWTLFHLNPKLMGLGRVPAASILVPCPNVSTTPVTARGCRQCLPLSVVQLQGKHCRKPHCRNRVVDTFRPWVPCPCFPLINHYYYKKSKTLYPNPKYLFGIGIWIWATKNLGSCVRSLCQRSSAGMTMRIGVALWTHWEKIMFSNSIQSLSIFAWAQWEK